MSLLRPITLLLVAAIANPMCCCLSFAETDLEVPAKTSSDPHACCHTASETAQPEQSSPSGDHDCFHEEIEGSKYSDNTGLSSSISTALVQQNVEYVDVSSLFAMPRKVAIPNSTNRFDPFVHATGKTHSQKYCVFIL